jgi:thiol-disulfide isomerase/thioredoxin
MNKIILLFSLIFSVFAFSQKIKLKVTGEKDTTVFLVKYYGKGMYYADTAQMKGGVVEFDGKKQKPGVLALLLSGQRYFDFVYNNDEVQLETQGPDFVKGMKVKKSIENTVFLNYISFMNEKRMKAKDLSEQREKIKKEDSQHKQLTTEIEGVSKEVATYQKNLVETYPSTLVSKIVKMSMEVEIPAAPKKADGSLVDSNFTYKYYRDHYFDNIDLNEDNLLNTPVFHNKLDFYFSTSMMIPHPDTVVKYAYRFVDKLNPKSEMFKYCLTHITSTYEKSNIMGMDKVFVRMGQRYYCVKNLDGSTNITWMEDDKLKELCKKVETYKNLVQGVVPPNITLVDTTDTKWRDFYSLKSDYTVLYFWDPECGHCKKTTPKLGELYTKKLKGRNVEVFAIGKAIGEDFIKWKKFIKDNNLTFTNVALTEKLYKAALEDARKFVPQFTTVESLNYQETYDIFSTPKIFVLDKDKKIIAKSLSISQLEDMLDHLQGKKNEPKLFPPDPEEEEHAKENK